MSFKAYLSVYFLLLTTLGIGASASADEIQFLSRNVPKDATEFGSHWPDYVPLVGKEICLAYADRALPRAKIENVLQDFARLDTPEARSRRADDLSYGSANADDLNMPQASSLRNPDGLDFNAYDRGCPAGFTLVSGQSGSCAKVPKSVSFESRPEGVEASLVAMDACPEGTRPREVGFSPNHSGTICLLLNPPRRILPPKNPASAGWQKVGIIGPDSDDPTVEIFLPNAFIANARAYLRRRLDGSLFRYLEGHPKLPSAQDFCRDLQSQQQQEKSFFHYFPITRLYIPKDFAFGRREDEQGAINKYTSGTDYYFGNLNQALRTGSADDSQKAMARSLSSFLETKPRYAGVVTRFSSLPASVLNEYAPGNVVTDRGFLSTSYIPGWMFRGDNKFIIHSVNGRAIDDKMAMGGEGEVIFMPGTRFTVISKRPWQSPMQNALPGFLFELEEVNLSKAPMVNLNTPRR